MHTLAFRLTFAVLPLASLLMLPETASLRWRPAPVDCVQPSAAEWADEVPQPLSRDEEPDHPPGEAIAPAQDEEPSSSAPPAPDPPRPAEKPPAQAPAAPRTRVVRMRVTAYCPCPLCCGRYSDGVTASGLRVQTNGSRFVAADTSVLPFHARVVVPGYSAQAVPVLDRGRRIRGNCLDVFFPTHAQAVRWGVRWLDVTVCEPSPRR